jgi:hypothetical protein
VVEAGGCLQELHRLASALLVHETLNAEQMQAVIQGKPITDALADGTEIKNVAKPPPPRPNGKAQPRAKENSGKDLPKALPNGSVSAPTPKVAEPNS